MQIDHQNYWFILVMKRQSLFTYRWNSIHCWLPRNLARAEPFLPDGTLPPGPAFRTRDETRTSNEVPLALSWGVTSDCTLEKQTLPFFYQSKNFFSQKLLQNSYKKLLQKLVSRHSTPTDFCRHSGQTSLLLNFTSSDTWSSSSTPSLYTLGRQVLFWTS